MEPHTLSQEEVKQILYDAGCPDGFTLEFLKTENATAQLQLLRRQRRCQLERVHSEEKKLDILDFLRDQLQRTQIT